MNKTEKEKILDLIFEINLRKTELIEYIDNTDTAIEVLQYQVIGADDVIAFLTKQRAAAEKEEEECRIKLKELRIKMRGEK